MSDYRVIYKQDGAEWVANDGGDANESAYDLTRSGDAGKLRFGVKDHRDCWCLSIDLIDGHDHRREMGYIKFGHDDNVPKDVPQMCFEFSLTRPGVDGDAAEVTVARLGLEKGLELMVGSQPGSASGSRLTSPNGRYIAQIQDDGNFVVYDLSEPGLPRPMWNSLGDKA